MSNFVVLSNIVVFFDDATSSDADSLLPVPAENGNVFTVIGCLIDRTTPELRDVRQVLLRNL